MKKIFDLNRRRALGITATGLVAAGLSGLWSKRADAHPNPRQESWVHGHSVVLQRPPTGAPPEDQAGISRAFEQWDRDGDVVHLPNNAGIACMRMGWGARFAVISTGGGDGPRSGSAWCHYSIPTPAINAPPEGYKKVKLSAVYIKWKANPDRVLNRFKLGKIDIYDGRQLIPSRRGLDGTAALSEHGGTSTIFTEGVWTLRGPIGVSILLEAKNAHKDWLEIWKVGASFAFI